MPLTEMVVAVVCRFGVTLLRSAPEQGVSRPPHTASRDCRNGSPLARAIPYAPAPECGDTREKNKAGQRCNEEQKEPVSLPVPTRSAACRAVMAGLAGEGGGRFGERREYEAPTLPITPRQHGMARHHTCQPRNSTSAKKQLTTTHVSPETNRHATTPPSQETAASKHLLELSP